MGGEAHCRDSPNVHPHPNPPPSMGRGRVSAFPARGVPEKHWERASALRWYRKTLTHTRRILACRCRHLGVLH
jgi:hypothetical protein